MWISTGFYVFVQSFRAVIAFVLSFYPVVVDPLTKDHQVDNTSDITIYYNYCYMLFNIFITIFINIIIIRYTLKIFQQLLPLLFWIYRNKNARYIFTILSLLESHQVNISSCCTNLLFKIYLQYCSNWSITKLCYYAVVCFIERY